MWRGFFLLWVAAWPLVAADTNTPAAPAAEVIEAQGIRIWKKGRPTNTYTTVGYDNLMRVRGIYEAQNRIALGVKARKGNAAIITMMVPAQRSDLTQNVTGVPQLDELNVRYEIIQLRP